MRIAWVTPVHAESAVATYSHRVVDALRRQVDVDIWGPSARGASSSSRPDVAFVDDAAVVHQLTRYDLVVYNIGDYAPYHRDIYALSRRHPGLIVLHDRALGGLFVGRDNALGWDQAAALEYVELVYGASQRSIIENLLSGRLGLGWTESDDLLKVRFTEQVLLGQCGAIVHSAIHATEVKRGWPGPVHGIPFPTYPELLAAPVEPPSGAADRIMLLTIGRLNANKHVHDVIELLAADRALAARVRYVLAGPAPLSESYPQSVSALIDRHGLRDTVKVLGRQSRHTLNRLLRAADVHVNLRYPALEGGSASAAEQLATGRPLVVYDGGSYAELPAEAALKLRPGDRDALAAGIWSLVESPALRTEMGTAARREAERRDTDSYARSLLGFVATLEAWPGRAFAQRVMGELAAMGVSEDMPTRVRVDRRLAELVPHHSYERDVARAHRPSSRDA